MHTNYKLSTNNNNNSHNANFNQLPDSGLNYLLNGMKVLSPRWSGPNVPTSGPSPPRQTASTFCKAAIFQTATNAASESAHYCNLILQSSNRIDQAQSRTHDHHYEHHQTHQQQQRTHARKHSPPPPFVHQSNATRTRKNNNKPHTHDHYQQEPLLAEHQRSQSPDPKTSSAEQHYQQYYSYYYNRQPDSGRKTNRKLPVAIMASPKKNTTSMNEGRGAGVRGTKKPFNTSYKYQASPSLDGGTDNNCDMQQQQQPPHKHHVLKEKMPNNNIMSGYDNGEWLTLMNVGEDEFIDGTADFIDVKDMVDLNFVEDQDRIKWHLFNNPKRKLRGRNDMKALDLSGNDARLEAGLNNNCPPLSDDEEDVAIQRIIKLPETPKFTKGGARAKKHSPPANRVLLYNHQSPRLSRLSPTSVRLQELRRQRSKSPLLSARTKQQHYCNRPGEANNSKAESGDCCVTVISSLKQTPLASVHKSSNKNEKPTTDGSAVNQSGAACDNDDNEVYSDVDDDDDDIDNASDVVDSSDQETSSDSENGYRSNAYKLTHSMDRVAATQSYLSSQASEESLTNPESVLVPSLFPNVPPYLAFSSNTHKGPYVPPELYCVLKWRVTNVMPKVVRSILSNSGMRLLKKTNDWMGIWGKHMKSPCFKTIRPYQKINHIPGSFKIGRKDACWRNLQKQMNKHGKKDFGFMPKTYIIPSDLNMLRKHWPKYAQRNVKFIIKPPASARGTGIRVVDRWAQIPKRKALIVQKYIERPLLINGSKFDLRLYVLVTSINPLRVFMYHNGLARFASVKYSDKSDTLNDRCMHLTNYSINKFSSNYSKNEDVNACHGHKWTIKSLWTYLATRGVRTDFLWEALRSLVLRTLIAGEQPINNMIKMNMESKYSCFELFGFDVLLDSDLIPWLLEVNISPSLHSELPLDAYVKAPLVQGVLNTALFNVPPKLTLEAQKDIAVEMSLPPGPICYDKRMYINYLSRAEKIKHNTFTRKIMEDRDEYIDAILENLTPDDVRCLIVAEDEMARCSPLERIFPTQATYKYLKYTDNPRYYNRLLDAWETRYGTNRAKGIALLREFCEEKYHLQVPPAPAKKDSSVNGGTKGDTVHSSANIDQVAEAKDSD